MLQAISMYGVVEYWGNGAVEGLALRHSGTPVLQRSKTFFPGDHGEEVTPVPIPNTEVKGLSGEGTAAVGRGRVARCRDCFLRAGSWK